MEPLDQYLRDIYPNASEAEISQYLAFIENGDSDRLPPTKEILEYIEQKAILDAAEKRIDELKPIIIEQKKRTGHNFSLLNIRSSTRRSYDESKLYEWAAQTFSQEIVDQITSKSINVSEFKRLESKGLIVYDELPQECFQESDPIWTLSLIKKKKG